MSELLLAIEQSAVGAGLSLMRGGTELAVRHWEARGRGGQPFFPAFRSALMTSGLTAESVTAFAVGLGPGIFSGLRVALAAARALALPGGCPVYGVSSGEVMAYAYFHDNDVLDRGRQVVVVGDARRGRLWIGTFERNGGHPRQVGAYELIRSEALPECLEDGDRVITPDWDRLHEPLSTMNLPDGAVIPRRFDPSPTALGRCVLEHIAAGTAQMAHSPIYMHPPVFVKPRFAVR